MPRKNRRSNKKAKKIVIVDDEDDYEPLVASPARSLISPIPMLPRMSPKKSSPKRISPKKLRNRIKKDKNDAIVVNIGDDSYEYNRADLIYDLEQGPVYFASYNATVDIADFINDIAGLQSNHGATVEEAEESIHLLSDKNEKDVFLAFQYAILGFSNKSDKGRLYVRNMFNRIMSVYRLYKLPDEEDVFLTVNSLDLLRDTKYKDYELVRVGRTKELIKLSNYEEKESEVYDLFPIGYKGDIPHLVDTKRNKKAYFGTKEITENLHELLRGFWKNTKGDDKLKIEHLIRDKYQFYPL